MSQSIELIEVIITIDSPRLDIDPKTSSPQGEHAYHYTNGDTQYSLGKFPHCKSKGFHQHAIGISRIVQLEGEKALVWTKFAEG